MHPFVRHRRKLIVGSLVSLLFLSLLCSSFLLSPHGSKAAHADAFSLSVENWGEQELPFDPTIDTGVPLSEADAQPRSAQDSSDDGSDSPASANNTISYGAGLQAGQTRTSDNDHYFVYMNPNGEVALYMKISPSLTIRYWVSGTAGKGGTSFDMGLGTGLFIYTNFGQQVWSAGINEKVFAVTVEQDGNIGAYGQNNKLLWDAKANIVHCNNVSNLDLYIPYIYDVLKRVKDNGGSDQDIRESAKALCVTNQ